MVLARFALLCFWFATQWANAGTAPIQINADVQYTDLSAATWLLEDPGGDMALSDVINPANAKRFKLGSPNIGIVTSAYWMRFSVVSTSSQPITRWFDSGNRTLQEIDLYWPDKNGTYERISTGSNYRFGDRPLHATTFVFPLALQSGVASDIYLRVRSTGFIGVVIAPRIWEPDAFRLQARTEVQFWSFFLGICSALVLLNLMLYLFNRDINFLLYSLSLVGSCWGLSSVGGGYGAAFEYFWPNAPFFEQASWVAAVSVMATFQMLFITTFLEFRQNRPTLTRLIYMLTGANGVIVWVMAFVTIFHLSVSSFVLQKAWALGAMFYIFLNLGLIYGVVTAAIAGNRSAKFIAVAFLPIQLAGIVFGAYESAVYGSISFVPLLSTWIFEAFVMAIAIADRYYQLSFEKVNAKTALIEGLKRSERDLEVRVEERTQDLSQANEDLKQTLESLKQAQKQLVQSEKMASLGGLVAGVAHEINTPVGIGVTAASHLEDETKRLLSLYQQGQMKKTDLEQYLAVSEQSSRMILNNLERAADLIHSFKQVAVDQSSENLRRFKVRSYLEEILTSLRPVLKKTRISCSIDCPDDIEIESFPGAFSQIVTNLVMNALKHAYDEKQEGVIRIVIRNTNGRLELEFGDDGKGMSAEVLDKIFDPFFTTKRGTGGSGLGLHIVYNLITQTLQGGIECRSQPEQGTTFNIHWPVGA